MNADQLKGILGKHALKESRYYSEGEEEDAYHEMMWEIDGWFSKPQTLQANVVTVELVEYQGGGEDVFPSSGGEIYAVLKVDTDGHVQYFKRSGKYQSYVGSEWDGDWTEVFPTEKTITVFE